MISGCGGDGVVIGGCGDCVCGGGGVGVAIGDDDSDCDGVGVAIGSGKCGCGGGNDEGQDGDYDWNHRKHSPMTRYFRLLSQVRGCLKRKTKTRIAARLTSSTSATTRRTSWMIRFLFRTSSLRSSHRSWKHCSMIIARSSMTAFGFSSAVRYLSMTLGSRPGSNRYKASVRRFHWSSKISVSNSGFTRWKRLFRTA